MHSAQVIHTGLYAKKNFSVQRLEGLDAIQGLCALLALLVVTAARRAGQLGQQDYTGAYLNPRHNGAASISVSHYEMLRPQVIGATTPDRVWAVTPTPWHNHSSTWHCNLHRTACTLTHDGMRADQTTKHPNTASTNPG